MFKPTILAIALICLLSLSHAFLTDAASSFSPTSNPNNGWTFGSIPFLNGTSTAFTTYATPSVNQTINFWGFRADAAKNNTANAVNFDGRVAMAPGQLTLHPSLSGQSSVARYTVPAGITQLNINSAFQAVDTVATGGVSIGVGKNGTHLYQNSLTFQQTKSYTGSIAVVQGDFIDFYVGWGADQNYVGDSTALRASIEAVPEPATMAALALGLVGLAKRRRK